MTIHTYAMLEIARQRQREIARQLAACQPSPRGQGARARSPRRLSARLAYVLTAVVAVAVTVTVVLVMATSATPAHSARTRPVEVGLSSHAGQAIAQRQLPAAHRQL